MNEGNLSGAKYCVRLSIFRGVQHWSRRPEDSRLAYQRTIENHRFDLMHAASITTLKYGEDARCLPFKYTLIAHNLKWTRTTRFQKSTHVDWSTYIFRFTYLKGFLFREWWFFICISLLFLSSVFAQIIISDHSHFLWYWALEIAVFNLNGYHEWK